MTKNEILTEISTEAFAELCLIADTHRGKYKPIYGNDANEKWWCVLYPAVHLPMNREFNIGGCTGLTFPTCDISCLPINLGNKFVFPSRKAVIDFGNEAKDWFIPFLFPEIILKQRMLEEETPIMQRRK